jgi:hypothetical protein
MARLYVLENWGAVVGGPKEQAPSAAAINELHKSVRLLCQELAAQRVATNILERRKTHRSVTVVGMPDLQDCIAFSIFPVFPCNSMVTSLTRYLCYTISICRVE